MASPEVPPPANPDVAKGATSPREQLRKLVRDIGTIKSVDPIQKYQDTMIHSYTIRDASESLGRFVDYKQELKELRAELTDWKSALGEAGTVEANDQRVLNIKEAIANTDRALAYPGATLNTVEKTVGMGGNVAAMYGGGTLGATLLPASLGTAGLIGGTVAGTFAPMAVEALTRGVKNPKAKSLAKTALYGGLIGGTALLAPQALLPIGVSVGISGLLRYLTRSSRRTTTA